MAAAPAVQATSEGRNFVAVLSGAQEVPPNDSAARGQAKFQLSQDGTADGVLAKGTITAEDLIARPDSAECPGGVSGLNDLLDRIRSEDAYVNVHTSQYPGGEIHDAPKHRGAVIRLPPPHRGVPDERGE